MKKSPASRALSLLALFASPSQAAQEPARPAPSPAEQSGLAVSVPAFPNAACPVMGKKVSLRLWAETERGRIYVCCKSCIQDVQSDVNAAYQTAYPATRRVENALCPVSGEPVGEKPALLTLQGVEFRLSNADHAAGARANAQAILAKLANPALEDLGNATCPVTDGAADPGVVVQIGTTLVRISSMQQLDAVRADPASTLLKARALRAQELARAEAAGSLK